MNLTEKSVQNQFTTQDFQRGRVYYQQKRVGALQIDHTDGTVDIYGEVHGSQTYQVHVRIVQNKLYSSCDCLRFANGYSCKHVAAVLCAYIREYQQDEPAAMKTRTDSEAARLLAAYLSKSNGRSLPDKKIHLQPRLYDAGRGYPEFSFQVGTQRMYVVKNLNDFVKNVYYNRTASYGKSLSFCHAIENFDDESQAMIQILMNEFPAYRTKEVKSWYTYGNSPVSFDKRSIQIEGDGFERLFDLLCNQKVPCVDTKTEMLLRVCDPKFTLQLKGIEGGAKLKAVCTGNPRFFGDGFHLYAMFSDEVLRCSKEFMEKLYPLVSACQKEVVFAEKDIPTLCDCVLSEAEPLADIRDNDGLLSRYTPDTCSPCYYFDLQEPLGLVGEVKYQYGEQTVSDDGSAKTTTDIKRNARAEQEFKHPLEQLLKYDEQRKKFYLSDEEEIIEFLTDHLVDFQKLGEVYISEQLRSKRVSIVRKPSVGISVSGGILTLKLDTGEFPPEELEALYDSLLRKKRYHRLADGRYLPLDGSGYEKLAEIAHMTQLNAQELKNGSISMPAFRGLYLDRVLGKNEEVAVSRNDSFRKMVRDFKSVEDSDFQIPAELESVLRPYQKTGFQWMKTLEANGFGGILADEMGLGKTIQVIAFLLTATRQEKGMPSLIVCPASLVLNWADELARFAPSLTSVLLMGNAAERKLQLESEEAQNADVWVTSYDLLKRDIRQYATKQFYGCVLDEGQNIKNQSALVSKAVKQIVCNQRFVLTGTPIENRLSELWNLFDFLMPGYLFSHSAFVNRLEKPIVQSGDDTAQRQLSLLVQPFLLRRLKKDVLKELPAKIEHVRRISLSEPERKVYQAAAHAARQMAEQTKEKMQILALLTRLRQICCDPSLCFENFDGTSSKLDACLELCESMTANGHQILLFSQFTTMLDHIRERLNQAGISSFTLEGSTAKEKRAQLVKAFNAGEASVFLISLKAGGTGLNLTSADVVIHYDPWWNLAVQNQATDRAHRIGQHNHVQVYKLIAKDTIEEKILQIQEKKTALMDAVTGEAGAEPLTKEEILELLQ